MAIYTELLVLTNTKEEAEDINASSPSSGFLRKVYAVQYGTTLNSVRFIKLENRYFGFLKEDYQTYIEMHRRNG